jgi:hypothetical protein
MRLKGAIASLLERPRSSSAKRVSAIRVYVARREAPAAGLLRARGCHRSASFGAPLPFGGEEIGITRTEFRRGNNRAQVAER